LTISDSSTYEKSHHCNVSERLEAEVAAGHDELAVAVVVVSKMERHHMDLFGRELHGENRTR